MWKNKEIAEKQSNCGKAKLLRKIIVEKQSNCGKTTTLLTLAAIRGVRPFESATSGLTQVCCKR